MKRSFFSKADNYVIKNLSNLENAIINSRTYVTSKIRHVHRYVGIDIHLEIEVPVRPIFDKCYYKNRYVYT